MNQPVVVLSMEPDRSPASQKRQLETLAERLADKELIQRLLRKMGLDPRQFIVYLGLFRTLSERDELIGNIGVSRFNIAYIAIFAAALGVLPWSIMTAMIAESQVPRIPGSGEMPESIFLLLNLFITFAFTFLILIREAATALFNPIEASMLAHSPIHSPTYTAAKITHIIVAVLYLVLGLNVFPVLLEIMWLLLQMFPGARWYLPAVHLVSAALIGLWTAFIICAFYGLMRRWVPASLLRSISAFVQLFFLGGFLVMVAFFPDLFFKSFLAGLLTARFENGPWTWLPLAWFAEVGRTGCIGSTWRLGWQGAISIIGSFIVIWFGLRNFSGMYLLEAIHAVTGRIWRKRTGTIFSRFCTAFVCAVTGSPIGTGIFLFVSKLIRRDWLFRRNVIKQTWIPLFVVLGILLGIARSGIPSLMSGKESGVQVLPHLLGLIAMILCINLPFTIFSKGSWIYLVAPIGSARAFARGIYWALWIPVAGLPHAVLFFYFIQFLSWEEAAFISGFNLMVVSLYLAFETRLISELPFSIPGNESRTMINGLRLQICGLIGVVIPILVHQALFGHLRIALLAAIALFVTTSLVLLVNLRRLEKEILWRLYEVKMGSNQMFRAIE